ncbi:monofunctional biosynthetic peptidoglycan transglycosylase [Rhodobacteraceae bacterium MBR-64]
MTRRPARRPTKRPTAKPPPPRAPGAGRLGRVRRWLLRGVLGAGALMVLAIVVFAVVPVPRGPYMIAESWRLGGIRRDWEPMARISPDLARSVVAAEDANFCLHWGFDMRAIRRALDENSGRGASTISQQVVKNVFLWQGRSWPRKALEAVLTPLVEAVWTKRRILEVYLNVAEFGKGVFGAEAAAQHYFGISAAKLSPTQAARLAAILPDPKGRDAAKPSAFVRERAAAIMDGAATIKADGRAGCFEA